ncbi:hypothetical protein XabCFBP2524_08280 [Xanthomonas axonopodis pv. begoniae]|nr:hypothetical protein XabCFBP2524_08280 [Xanthomonas axonopodis pv. begoniae]
MHFARTMTRPLTGAPAIQEPVLLANLHDKRASTMHILMLSELGGAPLAAEASGGRTAGQA